MQVILARGAQVMNLIAHKCAHVEITRFFDSAFPGVLLKRKGSALDIFRWDVTLAGMNLQLAGAVRRSVSSVAMNMRRYSFLACFQRPAARMGI